MKISLIFLLLTIVPLSTFAQTDQNFDFMTGNFSSSPVYLVFAVETESFKGDAVAYNESLYSFFTKDLGRDRAGYQSFAADLLNGKAVLKLKDAELDRRFLRVTKIKEVDQLAEKGKKAFIAHYFTGYKGKVIGKRLSDPEKAAVIRQLFKWQIALIHSCEDGALVKQNFEDARKNYRDRNQPIDYSVNQ